MANIMITESCNLKCPYCFANEFVNIPGQDAPKVHNHITIENFKKAVDFIITNPNERIGIIGGEPTMHPKFRDIMEHLILNPDVKRVLLFTNGVYNENYNNLFSHEKIRVLINCNSPENLLEAQYKRMTSNIDVLVNEFYMKDRMTLGINMYKENFNYDYIIELLDQYNFKHVRTSITIPNTWDKRNNNVIEYFKIMKPSVFRFFSELFKRNIVPNYDCNIMPICAMNQKEIDWIRNSVRNMSVNRKNFSCNLLDSSKCRPVIDILPNLNAVRCFGLSEELKVNIGRFRTIMDLENYLYNHFDAFAWNVFSSMQCRTCEVREKMRCTGGCLAFKVNKICEAREFCNDL